MSKPVHSSKCPRRQKSVRLLPPHDSRAVALYLNRRQWSFTALNSWTGSLSTGFDSRPELHLNHRQPEFECSGWSVKGTNHRLDSPPLPHPSLSHSLRRLRRHKFLPAFLKRGCAAATVEPLLKKSSPGSITFRSRTRRIAVFLNPGDPNSFLIHEEDSLISNSEVEL
jgi:hypothetical protein